MSRVKSHHVITLSLCYYRNQFQQLGYQDLYEDVKYNFQEAHQLYQSIDNLKNVARELFHCHKKAGGHTKIIRKWVSQTHI